MLAARVPLTAKLSLARSSAARAALAAAAHRFSIVDALMPPEPGAPAGPAGPVAPVAPGTPAGPAGPVAPVAPVAPVGPAGPASRTSRSGRSGGPSWPGWPSRSRRTRKANLARAIREIERDVIGPGDAAERHGGGRRRIDRTGRSDHYWIGRNNPNAIGLGRRPCPARRDTPDRDVICFSRAG